MLVLRKSLFCLALVFCGCFHRGPKGPEALAEARKLFDQGAQSSTDERVKVLLQTDEITLQKHIGNLRQGKADVRIIAEVTPAGAEQFEERKLYLVWNGEKWLPCPLGLLSLPPYTPKMALAKLLMAVEKGDCQTLISLCPPVKLFKFGRETLLKGCAEKQSLIRELVSHIPKQELDNLVVDGDRAWIEQEGKSIVKFVRFEGLWYIDDLI